MTYNLLQIYLISMIPKILLVFPQPPALAFSPKSHHSSDRNHCASAYPRNTTFKSCLPRSDSPGNPHSNAYLLKATRSTTSPYPQRNTRSQHTTSLLQPKRAPTSQNSTASDMAHATVQAAKAKATAMPAVAIYTPTHEATASEKRSNDVFFSAHLV